MVSEAIDARTMRWTTCEAGAFQEKRIPGFVAMLGSDHLIRWHRGVVNFVLAREGRVEHPHRRPAGDTLIDHKVDRIFSIVRALLRLKSLEEFCKRDLISIKDNQRRLTLCDKHHVSGSKRRELRI